MKNAYDVSRPGLCYGCKCGYKTPDRSDQSLKDIRSHFVHGGQEEKGKHESLGIIDSKSGTVVVPPAKQRHGAHRKLTPLQKREKGNTGSATKDPVGKTDEGMAGAGSAESSPESTKKSKGEATKPAAPKAIEVGKITITPENWGMDQHGAILILDTYNKAKRDIGYNGTIGDFLVDVVTLHRRIMNYGEVQDGRRDGGKGGNGHQSDDETGLGELVGDSHE